MLVHSGGHFISGFVYYEVDCFCQLRNPYIPLEAEKPTMQQEFQRNLTGEGREERRRVAKEFDETLDRMYGEYDWTRRRSGWDLRQFVAT